MSVEIDTQLVVSFISEQNKQLVLDIAMLSAEIQKLVDFFEEHEKENN